MTIQRIAPNFGRQRGMGLFMSVVFLAMLACIGVVGMQALPSLLEYQSIVKAVNKATREGGDSQGVRSLFDKATSIDSITTLSGKDLMIEKGAGDRLKVTFSYDKQVPIYGPVYLLIKYSGTGS